MMKLFCRENHNSIIEEPENYEQELIEAKARLAKLKKLPESSFAEKTHNSWRYSAYGLMSYPVDNKIDAIAKQEAEIAELEVLTQTVKGNKDVL